MNQSMNQPQYSVEIISSSVWRLNVSVSAEVFAQTKKAHIRKLASEAKFRGFRPGKTPERFIEQFYKDHIHSEALAELLQSSLEHALRQESLDPLSSPIFESIKAELNAPVEYVAKLEVYPKVPCPRLGEVQLERLQVTIDVVDIDRAIERMRRRHAQWQVVSRPADYGDRVSFDWFLEQGELNKDDTLILEAGRLPPGFADLIGSQAGDHIRVMLANSVVQPSEATLIIRRVEEPLLPEVNDEFAKQLGIEGGIEALRIHVRQQMQRQLDHVLRGKLRQQITEQLLINNPISELPKTLMDEEYKRLVAELRQRWRSQLGKPAPEALPEQTEQALRAETSRRVALGLLFRAFAKEHAIQVKPEQVQQAVIQWVERLQGDQRMVEHIYKNSALLASVEARVLEEQIIDVLLEQVQWRERAVSYTVAIQQDVVETADELVTLT